MISNFQFTPRPCKYHRLPQKYICLFPQCQYRAFLCSQCIKENHSSHLQEIKSFTNFIEHFATTVHNEEAMFERDKIVINVKDIIKSKKFEVEKMLNEVLINVVKMLDKQKELIFERLDSIEQKFQEIQTDYKKKLQLRFDCLQYLTSYKNNLQSLEARLYCSSEWGIVNLKNVLTDLKTFSSNQARNVNLITDQIITFAQNVLKQENNFIQNLRNFVNGYNNNGVFSPFGGSNNNSKLQKPPLNKLTKIKLSPNKNLSFLTANTRNSFMGDQKKRDDSLGFGIGRPRINSLNAIRNNSPVDSQQSKNRSIQMINKIPSLQIISPDKRKSPQNCSQGTQPYSNKFLRISKVVQF